MRKFIKRFLSIVLTVAGICSMCPGAAAMDSRAEENCVTFSHISQIKAGERVQHTIFDADGEKITVTIEKAAQYARAGGEHGWFNTRRLA